VRENVRRQGARRQVQVAEVVVRAQDIAVAIAQGVDACLRQPIAKRMPWRAIETLNVSLDYSFGAVPTGTKCSMPQCSVGIWSGF
jgi:hypothetical protein